MMWKTYDDMIAWRTYDNISKNNLTYEKALNKLKELEEKHPNEQQESEVVKSLVDKINNDIPGIQAEARTGNQFAGYNINNSDVSQLFTQYIYGQNIKADGKIDTLDKEENNDNMKLKKEISSSGVYEKLKKSNYSSSKPYDAVNNPIGILGRYRRTPIRKTILDENGQVKLDFNTMSDDEKFLSHAFTFKELELKLDNKIICYDTIRDYIELAGIDYMAGRQQQAKKHKYYTLAVKGKFIIEANNWCLENIYDYIEMEMWDFFQSVHYVAVDFNDQNSYRKFSKSNITTGFERDIMELRYIIKNDGLTNRKVNPNYVNAIVFNDSPVWEPAVPTSHVINLGEPEPELEDSDDSEDEEDDDVPS